MIKTFCRAAGICLLLLNAVSGAAAEAPLQERLIAEDSAALAGDARSRGDATRGAAVFYARAMACSTCHSVGDRPATIGPDLTKIGAQTSDAELAESVLLPSKKIAKGYASVTIETADGQVLTGLPIEETEARLVLRDAAQPDKIVTLDKHDIEQRHEAQQSIMPAGQVNQLADRQQFLDLMRFLIELRDGGAERARQLQPAPDASAQQLPDEPLPWQPVVQRGEVEVPGNTKYPRAVALGFSGGATVLFDADRLETVAAWSGGFVKSSPQNYFGLFWHQQGAPADVLVGEGQPLSFQLSDAAGWQAFEPPTTSDPNVGTRFDGYQIGKSAVRLHYRVLTGTQRVAVAEDVRAEARPAWQGFAREFHFIGLPAGARVAMSLPKGEGHQFYSTAGDLIAAADTPGAAPLVSYRTASARWVALSQMPAGWQIDKSQSAPSCRLVSPAAIADTPLVLRLDCWKYVGRDTDIAAADLASLATSPPQLNASFDAPRQPGSLPPPATEVAESRPKVVARPPVTPRENVDEFPPTRGRYLRFVITRTTGGDGPGIDELEVYGSDPAVNLALSGKASASSVIAGFPIHQIPHLNDGKLGNPHSWISAEGGSGWAQIEFPQPVEMSKIVWARDRTGVCQDRLAVGYRIEISDDGQKWVRVGDESGRQPPDRVVGAIRRDASPGYVMESIPLPFDACRPSDITFGDDGTMYAIAMTEGQIWRTRTPPPGHPERVNWQRYATGLYHPIGLAMVDGRLFVAQKPEITELIDRDGDGTVDQYRTVATGWGLSTGWHEYCFGLGVDPQKNLWVALNTGFFWTNPGFVNPGRWRGSVLRVSHDTENLEVMAKGCRVPNGICQGPEGNMFFTDNQGDWIQVCKLAAIVPQRFYGHPETREDALPKDTYPDGRSAVWFPYDRSRSTSGPVCDLTQGAFGPFANQMFVGDVGYGANSGILRVALEKVNGEYQGACFRFVDGQPLGCERMKFGPDHQLYSASLASGLTRMAYSGEKPLAIESVRIRPAGAGFVVRLTKPLAAETQLAAEKFAVKQYHYLYTGNYGSPIADQRNVSVQKAELSADRTEITLTLPVESYPIGMVYEMNFGNLNAADGEQLVHNEAWYTVHQIPK